MVAEIHIELYQGELNLPGFSFLCLGPAQAIVAREEADMLARYVYTGQLAWAIVAREEADMLAGLARLVSPAADR